MSKKKRAVIVAEALIIAVLIWYLMPGGLTYEKPEKVGKITVLDGASGERAEIKDGKEISKIMKNLRSVRMKKSKLSKGEKGYGLQISLYDKKDRLLDEFTVNDKDQVRKGSFLYQVSKGQIAYDSLRARIKQN